MLLKSISRCSIVDLKQLCAYIIQHTAHSTQHTVLISFNFVKVTINALAVKRPLDACSTTVAALSSIDAGTLLVCFGSCLCTDYSLCCKDDAGGQFEYNVIYSEF